jgi:uncharacterized delta-60 repeat protein
VDAGTATLAGSSDLGTGGSAFAGRLQAVGAWDTSFGTKGFTTADFTSNADYAEGIALTNGGIVIAGVAAQGSVNSNFALARFSSGGSLDSNFGASGQLQTDIDAGRDDAHALAVDASGRLLAAGENGNGAGTSSQFAVCRYTPVGALDATFGGGCVVVQPTGSTKSAARAVAVDASGAVVIAGYATIGGQSRFALMRMRP